VVVKSGTSSLLNETITTSKQQKNGHHVDTPNVNANGSGTNDHVGFVIVLGQATVVAAVNQCARSVIKDKANKPKLVFLRHFRSIFFSTNLVNVMILHLVV